MEALGRFLLGHKRQKNDDVVDLTVEAPAAREEPYHHNPVRAHQAEAFIDLTEWEADVATSSSSSVSVAQEEDVVTSTKRRRGWSRSLVESPPIEIEDGEEEDVIKVVANTRTSPRNEGEDDSPGCDHEKESLTRAYLDRLLQDQTLFRCVNPACKQIFERMEESHKPPERIAPDGQLLSEKHALHLQKCRYRCSSCRENFCLDCKTMPYHTGKTCEEHKESLAKVRCKYCNTVLPWRGSSQEAVCTSEDCIRRKNKACGKRLTCGHNCDGIAREKRCLPCLTCNDKGAEFCNLCWIEDLRAAPCVQLRCGHIFHWHCISKRLELRWTSSKISFTFAK
mmetsp:Transcript_12589/g.43889  ORF Transcript_12589/g.43889 Transcript_12589/m.43889 type:complete len:338 (+) Transcript_12589:217-1230(+)